MGETIEDMDKGIEPKDNTINFLTEKIGISHEETIKQMEKVNLPKMVDKTDRVIKRRDETLEKTRTNLLLKQQ